MGRKPNPSSIIDQPDLPEKEHALVQRTASTLMDDAMRWIEAGKQAGRIESQALTETVSAKAMVEFFIHARESRCYEGMPYMTPDGQRKHVSTLDDFCEHILNKGARRCRQLASNYQTLGAELYEQAEALGLRQRDYNALKALPAADQDVVTQALADGEDKESVIDKLVSLVERQSAEKSKLTKERDDANAQYEVREKTIAAKNTEIDRLQEKAALLPLMPAERKVRELVMELKATITVGLDPDRKRAIEGLKALMETANEADIDIRADLVDMFASSVNWMATVLQYVEHLGITDLAERLRPAVARAEGAKP